MIRRFPTFVLIITALVVISSFQITAVKAAPPAPSVTLNATQDVFIGDTFSFTATFDNIDTTDTGYGPFIDIVLPTTGADGATTAQTDDGISFVGVEYLGNALDSSLITTLTFPEGTAPTCVDHPLADSGPLTPLQVCGEPGDTLLVVQLPFGSFAPDQPPAEITINAQLSNLADLGTGLDIYSRGGFMYGDDPLQNPCCDPARVSDPDTNSANWPPAGQGTVTPTLATLAKENDGPEGETATGPNFPRTYTITLDVAPGQTLNNVTITDLIDNNIVVTGISAPGSSSITPAGVTPVAPFGPVNGGQINVNYASLNSSTSVTVTFYVPDLDANTLDIINPNSGDDAVTENFVSATASWSPLDGRDPDPTPVNLTGTCPTCPPTPDDTLTDKSIAIQKGVNTFPATDPLDARPDTVLEYTLNFEVSDYFNYADIEIVDLISDGQWLDTTFTPTFTVTDRTGTTAGSFTLQTANTGPVPACPAGTGSFDMIEDRTQIEQGDEPSAGDATDGTNGTTTLTFCVSLALENDGAADGIVQGGYTEGFTSGTRATGTITYRTVVLDAFTDNYPSNDPSVDHGDTLTNDVTITGEIRDNTNITVPLGTESDTSGTSVTLSVGTLEKSVYAIDGVSPGSPIHIQPGSAVTYRLRYDMPSTDFEDFVITDYLPLPVFDATTVTTFIDAYSTGPANSPAIGQAMYGPNDTVSAIMGATPGIVSDAVSNSVEFLYGDLDAPDNQDRTIDILFTVEVGNQPFADGLFLTNQANSSEGATNTAGHTEDAIIQVILDEPHILVKKGVIDSDNPAATYDPPTTNPASFPNINSAQLATDPVDSDVSGVDAGDTLDFAIVIENQGGNGAFDMVVSDILPPGMIVPVGGINLSVVRGDGTTLHYIPQDGVGVQDTNPTELFGNGIELVDPDANGVCQHINSAPGANIVIITYTLGIDPSAPPGTIQNIATVEEFSNTEGGPSFVDPTDPSDYSDDANIFIAPQGGKTIASTSEAYTGTAEHDATLNDLTIGEEITYTLTSVIPESSVLDTLTVVDNLPAGMVAVSAQVDSIGANIQNGGGATPTPAITGIGTQTVTFDFGNIRNPFNNTADDEIIMTVVARVVNTGGPTNGNTLTNQMAMTYGAATQNESVDVDVVEPNLNIAKTETGGVNTGDAGDILNFRILVTHRSASTADAFDLVITDDLAAAGLELVAVTSATSNGSGTVTNNNAGNNLNITLDTLEQGSTLTILYQARIADSTRFESELINTANLSYDSLDADGGTDERTYTRSDDYTVNTNKPLFEKGISSTSNSATFPESGTDQNEAGKDDVSIGERVTYRLTVTMAEGTDDIQIVDTVPASMEILSATVVSLGGDTTNGNTSGGNISGSLLAIGADETDANITIDNNGGTNNRVTYNFGTTVFNNPAGPIAGIAGDQIIVEFVAVVLDVGANVDDFDLVNDATVTYTNGSVTSNQVIVEVVEPDISMTKVEEGGVIEVDAGDILTFRVTVTNAATASGPAHDVRILDDLAAAGMELDSIISATGPAGSTVTNNSTGNTLDVVLDTLSVGGTFTIRYRARIANSNPFGERLTNTANLTYDSNPDEPGTPEREGTPLSATYDVDTTTPDIEKGIQTTSLSDTFPGSTDQNDTGVFDVAIGETVTYRITVTLEEGTDEVIIVDTLPAVMEVVSAQVVSLGGDTTNGNTSGGNISGSLLAIGADETDANITIDTNVTANDRVTLNFGANVLNTPDGLTNTLDQIVVDVTGVVVDNVAMTNDVDLVNDSDLIYGNGTVTSDDAVTVEVVEPVLSLTKTFAPDVVIRGDTITMTLFVENTGTAPAYDFQIVDTLDTFLDVTNVATAVSDATHTTATPDNTNVTTGDFTTTDIVVVDVDSLWPGQSVTVTVTLFVNPSLALPPPDVTITNEADVTNITTTPGTNTSERTYPDVTGQDVLTITHPDVSVTKTDSVDPVVAGDQLVYTITINNGTVPNATATNIVVTDNLPPELTVTLVQTSAGGLCAPIVGGVLTCNFPSIPPGGTSTILVTGIVSPVVADGTVMVNNVSVDFDERNNAVTTSEDTTVTRTLDLSITKTVNDPTPSEGDLITYTLIARNNGPANASNVTVTDTLPAGVTYVRFVPTTHPCTAAGLPVTVTCTFPTVAAGANRTIGIEVTVDGGTTGQTIANTADVTSTESGAGNVNETIQANNTDSADIIVDRVDLAVVKTVNDNTPNVGDTITYTLNVSNNGPADATNIVVTDTLPAPLTFVSSNPAVCTEAPADTLTCNLGDMLAGGSTVLTIQATVDTGAAGTLTNTATVTSDQSGAGNVDEVTAANNDDTADITVGGIDLVLQKTANPTQLDEGDSTTYTITVNNNGAITATGVVVTDTLDPGLTFVSSTPATCTPTANPGEFSCILPDIAAGRSTTLRITATADPGTAGQTLDNVAVVAANETEPDLTNNTDNATVFVRQVDLSITKTVNNTTPAAPGQVIYTLTVVNNGPGDATNVVVTDILDGTVPGLTFVSSNPAICVEAPTDTLTCTIGNLLSGRNATIRITANVDAGAAGTLTNTASVTSSESGPANANETDDTNNTDDANIAVGGVNLAITKTVNDTAPDHGDTITYTLEIENTGATNATGVTVVDNLDTTAAGLTFVSSNPAICTEAPVDTLTCTIGNLAAGATTTITLDVTVDAGAAGVLTNTATVSANEPESDNTDNTDDQDVSVGVVDVAVTKVVDNPTPNTGDTVTYTVTVTNNGPSTATGVEVTESLPIDNVNLTLLNATASGTTTFIASPPASIWDIGTLAPGQTETLTLDVRVEIPSGSITNTVTITNVNETDTDNTNDTDTALITLGGTDISVTKSVDDNIPETGDTILYTVIARNNGPNPATGVQILDALPAGVTFQAPFDATHGTYDDTTGIWDIGPLNVNEQARLRVPAVVTASGGIIINVASLDAVDQADSDSTNNTADAPIYIGAADLRLEKVMLVGGPHVGDPVQYRLTITNQGPNQATGVQVTDNMPAGVTYTGATSSQGTFTPAPSATILWNVGALNVGQSATLTIDGQLNSITASKLNTAEVTASNQPDPDSTPNNGDTTEDDYAEAESPGIFDPPYGLKVFDDNGLPELEWTMVWVNPSNVPAINAEVFDDIPAGTTYKAGSLVCSSPGATTTSICEYDAATNRIHWQGTLAPDPGATTVAQANNQLIIRFRVIVDDQVRRVQNQASLRGPAGLSVASNVAVWEAPSDGGAAPDLKLAKSVEPPFAQPGDTVVWTIPVLNEGANTLDHVRVTDVIDLELEILDISATRGTISMNGREVIVEINQLQPGEQVIIKITTRVSASAPTPFIILNTVYARDKYAEAILVSAEELPATGEAPPWRIPLIAGIGTLLIITALYTGRKQRNC